MQVAYAIGVAKPMGVYVHTFGTGKVDDDKLGQYVAEHFDMRPRAIIEGLDLLRPIYRATASYGHFGRSEFSWERTDRAEEMAADLLGKPKSARANGSSRANGETGGSKGGKRRKRAGKGGEARA